MQANEPDVRRVPHSIEAEQALLGALLLHNDVYDRISEIVQPAHFYDPLHQQIYETAAKLIGSGKQATPITMRTFFENAEPIDANLTVPQYLGKLVVNATTLRNAPSYASTVRDSSIRRELIVIGGDIAGAAYDAPVDFPPTEQIEEAERRLYALASHGSARVEASSAEVMAEVRTNIEAAYKAGKRVPGLSTGYRSIDAKLGALKPGDLIILAGRPAIGKTALATNIVQRQAGFCHFFSCEMSRAQIGLRLIADATGIDGSALQRGDLTEKEWRQYEAAEARLKAKPMIIDDRGGLTIAQIQNAARRVKRLNGTSLIVVDYLQLVAGTRRNGTREAEVSDVAKGLKALAKDLSVPVLALAQLNRNLENRENKRPQLADLRDSGAIEQDADAVLFVHREAYFLAREKPSSETAVPEWAARLGSVADKAEVIVAKNRFGPEGIVNLNFNDRLTRFSDPSDA